MRTVSYISYCSASTMKRVVVFYYSATILLLCSSLPGPELMQSVPLLDNVTCAEHFENVNGSCVARCDAWEQSPHGVTIALTVVELVAASFGLLAGITLILLSVLKRRHM